MTISKNINQIKELTTQADVTECLAAIKSLHPNYHDDRPELTIRLWHYHLKQFDKNIVKQSTMNVAATSKYVPKLSEILDEIEKISNVDQNSIRLIDNETVLLEKADKWWLSLSSTEQKESHQRQLEYINGKDVDLTAEELCRVEIVDSIQSMLEGNE